MGGRFNDDALLEPAFGARLEALLGKARSSLGAEILAIAELAAPDGEVVPIWRAWVPADMPPPPLSLDAFEHMIAAQRTGASQSGQWTGGLAEAPHVVPLAVQPRVARGIDAVLLLWPSQPIDESLLAELVRCLEVGMSADRRARLSEVVFEAVEQAADPMELTDRNARLLYANQAWQETFGYPVATSLGNTVGQLFRDPVAPVHDAAFYQFTLAKLANGQAWSGALACRHRNGERVYCEPMVSPFTANGPLFEGNFAVRRNLKARVERDRALAVAHQEFRAVLSAVPDAVVVLREDTVYFANEAFLRMVHQREEEVIGRAYVDFLLPEDRETFLAQHAAGLTRVRMRRLDGTVRFAEISPAGALSFEGQPAKILVCRDVTDQRIAQEQLSRAERLSALGALAAGIAHEINNPLAYVMLNLRHIASEATLPASLAEVLTETLSGAERIKQIVAELRTYTGADSVGAPESVEVDKAVVSALNIARNEIRHRAQLEQRLEPGLHVLAREGPVVQVLVNLLVNAAQAIPLDGSKKHTVTVTSRRLPNGQIEIRVADTGQGVPPSLLPHIFEAFATAKQRGEGQGLGLAIAKRIVEGFDGEITIESEWGSGTTASVRLPAAAVPASVKRPQLAPRMSGRCESQRRARILIVDDEVAVAAGLVRMLPQYNVTCVADGHEALSLLQQQPGFGAVMCDLMMPGLSGPDLYQKATELDAALKDRFVFMTGGAFLDTSRQFLEQTDCQVLNKPFDIAGVRAALERVIDASTTAVRNAGGTHEHTG